jgi:hypothetical protein
MSARVAAGSEFLGGATDGMLGLVASFDGLEVSFLIFDEILDIDL